MVNPLCRLEASEDKAMKIFRNIPQLRGFRRELCMTGTSVGLVPTMGYLHEGHLSLIRRAKQQTDSVWVSIFVNPTQFGPKEDLEKYPRDESRDLELCEKEGVDAIFIPAPDVMYAENHKTFVYVEDVSKQLCGETRPVHFKGVTTVVAKLFNIVQPMKAYFGQKDAQQALIIERMARELNSPVGIVVCPTVREADGLAMSSRNIYLSSEQRNQAVVLSQALEESTGMFLEGVKNPAKIIETVEKMIINQPEATIDYVSIVSPDNFLPPKELKGGELLALAVYFGPARLIDNTFLGHNPLLERKN